jgi:hypothetical protein
LNTHINEWEWNEEERVKEREANLSNTHSQKEMMKKQFITIIERLAGVGV